MSDYNPGWPIHAYAQTSTVFVPQQVALAIYIGFRTSLQESNVKTFIVFHHIHLFGHRNCQPYENDEDIFGVFQCLNVSMTVLANFRHSYPDRG